MYTIGQVNKRISTTVIFSSESQELLEPCVLECVRALGSLCPFAISSFQDHMRGDRDVILGNHFLPAKLV